jgi:hypothetical protein
MRKMTYLSPTSLKMFCDDKALFYMTYLADNRLPRAPQTNAMAVGSSFDAYAKSYLYNALFGKKDSRFELMALFEAQVESQNRDKAYAAGKHCFEEYKSTGALVDMMLELKQSTTEPRFEFDIMGQVDGRREGVAKDLGPVPFLGKPDVYFTNTIGARVIYDWKVNGFYSRASPMKGYIRCREGKQSHGSHKDCIPQLWKGMKINVGFYLEQLNADWARQLAIYAWLCGEEVGTNQCIVGIDQLACQPDSIRPYPKIRVAEHRLRLGKDFQQATFALAQDAWAVINSDHFFRDISKEESQEKCKLLEGGSGGVVDGDDWYSRMAAKR